MLSLAARCRCWHRRASPFGTPPLSRRRSTAFASPHQHRPVAVQVAGMGMAAAAPSVTCRLSGQTFAYEVMAPSISRPPHVRFSPRVSGPRRARRLSAFSSPSARPRKTSRKRKSRKRKKYAGKAPAARQQILPRYRHCHQNRGRHGRRGLLRRRFSRRQPAKTSGDRRATSHLSALRSTARRPPRWSCCLRFTWH